MRDLMDPLAKQEKRSDILWGVVNSGNALVHSIHRRKIDALIERRLHASAYAVIRVEVIPIYK